jgi:outer membrane protein assembly factor BamD (BamD/ComL family)
MTGIRQGKAQTVTLVVISLATIAGQSRAQFTSRAVADHARKTSQDPIGDAIQGAPKLPSDGEFQSAPTLFRLGKVAEAERQFAWIASIRKGTSWGERSQYYVAECQYRQKRYLEALASLERLHTDYPATDYLDQLVRREYEIAQLWITWAKTPVLAGTKASVRALRGDGPPLPNTEKLALRALDAVRHTDPTGPLADDATIQLADYYMINGNYDSATAYYDQFLAEYRKSPFCPHARLGAFEARFRMYLLSHRDTAGLKVARDLAKLSLRAFLKFDNHVEGR